MKKIMLLLLLMMLLGFTTFVGAVSCDSTISVSPCHIDGTSITLTTSVSNKEIFINATDNSALLLTNSHINISNSTIHLLGGSSDGAYFRLNSYSWVKNVTIDRQSTSNVEFGGIRGDFTLTGYNNSFLRISDPQYNGYSQWKFRINNQDGYNNYYGNFRMLKNPNLKLGTNYIWVNETDLPSFVGQDTRISFDKSDMGYPDSVTDYKLYKDGILQVKGTNYTERQVVGGDFIFTVNHFSNWSIVPNGAPNISSIRINPEHPISTSNLEGYCKADDIENDNLTFYYKWWNGSNLYNSGNTSNNYSSNVEYLLSTINSSLTNTSENWTFSCMANDGSVNSSWQNITTKIYQQISVNLTAPSSEDIYANNDSVIVSWDVEDNWGDTTYNIDFYNGTDWNNLKSTMGDWELLDSGTLSNSIRINDMGFIRLDNKSYRIISKINTNGIEFYEINESDGTNIGSAKYSSDFPTEQRKIEVIDLNGDGIDEIINGFNGYNSYCNMKIYQYNSSGDNWYENDSLLPPKEGYYGLRDCNFMVTENMLRENEIDLIVQTGYGSNIFPHLKYGYIFNRTSQTWAKNDSIINGLPLHYGNDVYASYSSMSILHDILNFEYVASIHYHNTYSNQFIWDVNSKTWKEKENAVLGLYSLTYYEDYINSFKFTTYTLFSTSSLKKYNLKRTNQTIIDLSTYPSMTNAQVRINATDSLSSTNYSYSGNFTVDNMQITLTQPSGGELFYNNDSVIVSWNVTQNLTNPNITIEIYNGTDYEVLKSQIFTSQSTTVNLSRDISNAKIRISANDTYITVQDESDTFDTVENTKPNLPSTYTNPINSTFSWINITGYCVINDSDTTDANTVEYRWTENNTIKYSGTISGTYTDGQIANTTLSSSFTTAEDNWTFSCRTYDGYEYSDWVESDSVYIINPKPTMDTTIINNDVLSVRTTPHGFCNATDPNNSSFYYYYRWYINNSIVNSGVSSSTPSYQNDYTGSLSIGDIVMFSCIASDGDSNATNWQNSTSKTVVYNTAPNYNSSYIAPTNDTGTLNAYCMGYDANEDGLEFNYKLFRNGSLFSEGTTTGGVSEQYKLVASVNDADNITYLKTGDKWILSCQISDTINTSDYHNSSEITITKDEQSAIVNDIKMFPIILMNDSTISATANASDINFDDLTYIFTLYESNTSIQEKVVDDFEDGIFDTNIWRYVRTGSDYWVSSYFAEEGGVLKIYMGLGHSTLMNPRARLYLDAGYSQRHYNIKKNNLNISFDLAMKSEGQTEDFQIRVGNYILYSEDDWDDYGKQHYDLKFYDETNMVELYRAGSLVGSANLTAQVENPNTAFGDDGYDTDGDDFFLNFRIPPSGNTNRPAKFTLYNVNVTGLLPDGFYAIEQQNVTSTESQEVSVNFSTSPLNVSSIYQVGVIVNDGTLNSSEEFSLDFTTRSVNNPPTSTTNTNPGVFIGTDDDIEGYCKVTDEDGDTIEYLWKWYINGVEVKSGNLTNSSYYKFLPGKNRLLDTLTSNYTEEGDNITFSCAGRDAHDTGNYSNTTQYIWSENNYAPSTPTVTISPSGSQYSNVSFTINATSTDDDGDLVQYEWRFIKNSEYQQTKTTGWFTQGQEVNIGNLSSENTSVGDTWYVQARAWDNNQYSSWGTSNSISIANRNPIMDDVQIIGTPTENNTLTTLCNATDEDSQSLTYEYKWYENNVSLLTGNILPFNYTQVNEDWILSCRAYDGVDYSSWKNSSSITITDSSNPATLQNVSIISNESGIYGKCLVDDEDGDTINYGYKWYNNGSLISQGTSSKEQGVEFTTLLSSAVNEGDSFIFSCSANDTDGSISYTNSTSLDIPSISFSYVIANKDIDYIKVDWTTDADKVYVYRDNTLLSITTLTGYTYEGLSPNTEYELKLIPFKLNYYGTARVFNETTEETDNNNPTMQDVFISPTTAYTNDVLSGYCRGTDIESQNIFYTYTWKVNDTIIDTGVTSLQERNSTYNVGSLTSSHYKAGDNVTLICVVNDGIGNSSEMDYTTTIQNTEPDVEVAIIYINGSNYECENTYEDADNDPEITPTYKWFKNGVDTGLTLKSISASNFAVDDKLICEVTTGDATHNITLNTSEFLVGDFEAPTISDISVPSQTYTDTSYSLGAICEDNNEVATGYPRIRFINPNLQEEEYQLFYQGGNQYSRYHTFSIAGTYTNFEVECKDANNNQKIETYNGSLVSLVRETVVTIGGGGSGGSGEEEEEFRNITSFKINPQSDEVNVIRGGTKIVEFEVENTDIVDISFTSAILVTEDTESYQWMEFEGGKKAITFNIEQGTGLTTNNRYIRYYVRVPSDAEIGQYKGMIEINGLEQTQDYEVIIHVQEGTFTTLKNILNYELFGIPYTQSVTGSAIAPIEGGDFPKKPFKVWHLLLTISLIGGLGFAYWKFRP